VRQDRCCRATALGVAWQGRVSAIPAALGGRSVAGLAVRAAGLAFAREGASAVARMRIREGTHAGCEGELVAELSDPQVAYLRIRLSSGRTVLLVAERTKLEPAPAPPARVAFPPRRP
jgi:hypothetical protein